MKLEDTIMNNIKLLFDSHGSLQDMVRRNMESWGETNTSISDLKARVDGLYSLQFEKTYKKRRVIWVSTGAFNNLPGAPISTERPSDIRGWVKCIEAKK